jgi:hypothetical protein
MNEIQWVPGFIRVTSGAGTTYWQFVAEIVQFSSGTRGDTPGSYITLRGEDEGDRFVMESPDQIADLIRQEWEGGVSLRAEIQRAVESGEAA